MTLSRSTKASGRVLLPSHFIPERYDIEIEPDLDAFTFQGKVTIRYKVDPTKLTDENRQEITLHAKELCFVSARYKTVPNNKEQDSVTEATADEIRVLLSQTEVILVFSTTPIPITATALDVTIVYTGFLNNQMAGFYRSQYTDIQGQAQIMASTQFESLDARRAFPCVDEPAAKAVFGLTLIVPANRQALSNMPVASFESILTGGNNKKVHKKKIQFMDTPKMSTYLLAFCVGEFDCVQQELDNNSNVLVSVWTPPGKAEAGRFALSVAVRSLQAYNAFFGLPYPLPKLDMIAIPEFAAGAMENWGLVTYREVDLLIDPVTASSQQKQRVTTVVTHELAHQWFGNLVTMAWWDDLWLNEGFASWAENYASDLLFPDYKMWEQFTTDHLASALRLDALQSSHPIQVPIQHAEEVEQVFDAISYCKGGSVVKMIRAVLGMKAFQTGLAAYMKKHAYGNTETFDLWAAWETASGMPVGEMMASWTEQMGFPLLRVIKEDWQSDKVILELDQLWFLADGSSPAGDENKNKTWTIPIMTCTDAGNQEDMTLMREKSASITIPLNSTAAADGWVKLNAGQEVPMRVLHTEEMLRRLAPAISSKKLSAIDRAGLINDSYALVKAGHMKPEALIHLLGNFKDDDSYIVWESLASVLGGLDTVLSDDEVMSAHLNKFAKSVVLGLMDKVGWDSTDSDGHLTTLLRSIMIGLLSNFAHDDESVAKEASTRFAAFLENAHDVKSLPTDMRVPVFKIILKNGGAKEYEQVKSYYYKADTNAEKKHVLNTLGSIQDPKLKVATMDWATSGEIKIQDFFYAMGSVGRSSKEGREISWQYFKDNFDKIKGMVQTASPSLMDACIVMCAGGFCSRQKADEMDDFFASHPLPKNTRKIAQTTESMRANAKFLDILQASDLAKDDFWSGL